MKTTKTTFIDRLVNGILVVALAVLTLGFQSCGDDEDTEDAPTTEIDYNKNWYERISKDTVTVDVLGITEADIAVLKDAALTDPNNSIYVADVLDRDIYVTVVASNGVSATFGIGNSSHSSNYIIVIYDEDNQSVNLNLHAAYGDNSQFNKVEAVKTLTLQ